MAVYFVHDDHSDWLKIGFSENPWGRMSKMQADCPGELTLLAILQGGRDVEAEVHQRFASARERGEWFRFTPELRAYVASLPEPYRAVRAKSLAAIYAEATGVCYSTANAWIVRGRVPPTKYWIALTEAGLHTLEELARAAAAREAPILLAPANDVSEAA